MHACQLLDAAGLACGDLLCPATFTRSTSVKTRAVLALNIYHQMIRSSHMYMIEINSKSLSPAALAASLGSGNAHDLLDVRTPPEYSGAHVPGARLIPLGELKAEVFLAQQKPGTPIHVLRQAGTRAKKAIELFEHSGCEDCDIRFWADQFKQLQRFPHYPAHCQAANQDLPSNCLSSQPWTPYRNRCDHCTQEINLTRFVTDCPLRDFHPMKALPKDI